MDIYPWRGLMVDTARHMPSLTWLYRTVDTLNSLNFSTLHVHLSDDQGFRFESKKFPRLNEIGSWRRETAVGKNFPSERSPSVVYEGDGVRYGGYYTQEELRGLVSYARGKNITVVPEIDIPGHTSALLASYPNLGVGAVPREVATWWGVFKCGLADTPQTHEFVRELFTELCEVFDSPYIHIGGDEVQPGVYSNPGSPDRILKTALDTVRKHGRTPIVWDEAASFALSEGAVIMNWRKLGIGIEHLSRGGRVIFCPSQFFYFDFYQKDPATEPLAIGGYLPAEIVAGFKLGPDIIQRYGDRILGIQANLWTEYMPTEEHMDYMLLSRLRMMSTLRP